MYYAFVFNLFLFLTTILLAILFRESLKLSLVFIITATVLLILCLVLIPPRVSEVDELEIVYEQQNIGYIDIEISNINDSIIEINIATGSSCNCDFYRKEIERLRRVLLELLD